MKGLMDTFWNILETALVLVEEELIMLLHHLE